MAVGVSPTWSQPSASASAMHDRTTAVATPRR